jgi:hypothetical protein
MRSPATKIAGHERLLEVLSLPFPDLALFFDRLGQHAALRPLRENVVVVINIENQERAVLFRQRNAFIVDQAGMFDRIDPGANRVFNRVRSMRVGGHFAA